MSETDLEAILRDQSEEATQEAQEAEDTSEAEGQEATTEDTTGDTQQDDGEQTESQQEEATPASQQEDQRQVPLTALQEERRKRQELEQRLRNLEQQGQNREQQQEGEQPDWWEDPEKAAQTLEQRYQSQLLNERFNMSEMLARQQLGDETVEEDLQQFQDLVQQRPHLAQELRNSTHPYQFVHETVQKERVASEIGDPESYKQKLLEDPDFLAQVKQKLGMDQQPKQSKSQKASPPPSLANETSAMGRSQEGPPTHRSLDDILNG